MTQHHPQDFLVTPAWSMISWTKRTIVRWTQKCNKTCLDLPDHHLNTTSIESPEKDIQVEIPKDYHDLLEFFSKTKAPELPPHCNYDCAIELLPGTSRRARVYPLCPTEQWAMEEYIQEALKQKYIVPSTSPASAGFFFIEKKDGGLRPTTED